MADRIEMPWWGWGDPNHSRVLAPSVEQGVVERLGALGAHETPAALEHFNTLPSRVPAAVRQELEAVAGIANVSDQLEDRIRHSAGKSYPDLVRMRSGKPLAVPDLVVCPPDPQSVQGVIDACVRNSLAVVPFGGGTSVVGGVDALMGRFDGVISLDMRNLSGLISIEERDRVARLGAGLRGPEAERLLNGHGFTLGHFPQSFEFATIGGFAATRSSGQASTGYGRFDANVIGLEMATPSGFMTLPSRPGTAAGPDLRAVAVGSEGVLGAITSVEMELKPVATRVIDTAWVIDGFMNGRELLRELEQGGCAPTVARLSDEDETSINLALAGSSMAGRLLARYANVRGRRRACLLIAGFEGADGEVERRSAEASRRLIRGGAHRLPSAVARSWRRGRFHGPYLRDVLMSRGLLVDTLETAACWSELDRLYTATSSAIRAGLAKHGGDPIVMCHVSHLYNAGASLYFTFIGRQPAVEAEERIATWRSVKSAACEAIVSNRGTITHHHAIGTDHSAWMTDEVGGLGISMLRSMKEQLDPLGIMNPGKLLPVVSSG